MRYTFRINVSGHGYRLYSYGPDTGLRTHPPATASEDVPPEYLRGQEHIDRLLYPKRPGPYLWAGSSGPDVLVIYGCRFEGVRDQYDRPWTSFVCGFWDRADRMTDAVGRVVWLASPAGTGALYRVVAKIAVGEADPADLVDLLDAAVPAPGPDAVPATVPVDSRSTGTIVHDSGGVVFAWQAMVLAHRNAPGPWSVCDDIDEDNCTVTRSSDPDRTGRVRLSDYLRQAANQVQAPQRPDPPTAPAPGTQPRPAWLRPVLVGAGVASVALNLVLALGLALSHPANPPATSRRVLAQYDYQFVLPDGWVQTGGGPDGMSTEIRPGVDSGDGKAVDNIVVLETKDDSAQGGTADGVPPARPTTDEDPTERTMTVAGRDVVYQRERPDRVSVVDSYSLWERGILIEIRWQHGRTDNSRQSACDEVIRSLTIFG